VSEKWIQNRSSFKTEFITKAAAGLVKIKREEESKDETELKSGHQTSEFVVKTFNKLSSDSSASIKEYANLASAHIIMLEEESKTLNAKVDTLESELERLKKEINSSKISSGRNKQLRQQDHFSFGSPYSTIVPRDMQLDSSLAPSTSLDQELAINVGISVLSF
jgi:hypothetical protein